MELAVLERKSGLLRRRGESSFRVLRRCPDLEAVIGYERGTVYRLERSMLEIGREIVGLDNLRRRRERRFDIAFLDESLLGWTIQPGSQACKDLFAIDVSSGSAVPALRHRVNGSFGLPPVIGDDGNRARRPM